MAIMLKIQGTPGSQDTVHNIYNNDNNKKPGGQGDNSDKGERHEGAAIVSNRQKVLELITDQWDQINF